MRFLVDENLGSRFVKVLSAHGYDIMFVGDAIKGKFIVVKEGQIRVRDLK